MTTTIPLRPATQADWPGIEAMLTGADLPLAGARDHLGDFFVVTSDGIVGCIGLERYGNAGLLRSLAVSTAHRDHGYGRALVDACVHHARSTGVETLALLTTTAEPFFARLGFMRVQRDQVPAAVQASMEFRGACPASAVAMLLDLAP
jgi:N-acetylglutamate synthase-like GNAT family acetyltransferase